MAKTAEQIQAQIKNLQVELRLAQIREGKGSLAQEVKKRILEVCPGIPNLEYVLLPIRIYEHPEAKVVTESRTRIDWSNPEIKALEAAGDWDTIKSKFGATQASINCRKSVIKAKSKSKEK